MTVSLKTEHSTAQAFLSTSYRSKNTQQ